MHIAAKRTKTCLQCIDIPTELLFCVPPLVVGFAKFGNGKIILFWQVCDMTSFIRTNKIIYVMSLLPCQVLNFLFHMMDVVNVDDSAIVQLFSFQLMYFDLEAKEMDLWDPAGTVSVAGVMIMLAVGEQ